MRILNGNGNLTLLRDHLRGLANELRLDASKDPVKKRAGYKTKAAEQLIKLADSRAVNQLAYYGE